MIFQLASARSANGRWAAVVGTALIVCGTAGEARAVPTATFESSSFAELDGGKPQGTLISSEGEVVVGNGIKPLKGLTAAMVWSRTRDANGRVYFGTGDPGRLLTIRNGRAEVVADLKAVLITTLAIGPGGKLLAGTMPDARVLEVDPRTGKWRELSRLPATHIWSVHYDAKARLIYAASGAPGKVFVMPASGGKPTVYYDPGEQHLLCMRPDAQGNLLVGSSEKAILYRITGKSRGIALHDFDASELRSVAAGPGGVIYAAVNKFPRKTSGLPRYYQEAKGEGGTPLKTVKAKPDKVRAAELRPGAKAGQGALYRIDPDGRIDELLTLSKGYFTDLEIDADGSVWAGDGTEGKLYIARPDRTVLTAFDVRERQVLAVAVDGPNKYLATGDAGAIYQITSAVPRPAYISRVFDAKFSAHWGSLRYQATGPLRLHSRSGNTAKPDDTWHGWQPAKVMVADRVQLRSPAARYLQVKVEWPTANRTALRSFTAYYRPQNQRARVTEIEFDRKQPKGKPRAPSIKIKWKVDNPDGDALVYRLYYREEMGVMWRRIKTTEPIEKTEHDWDTEPVPDDYYRIKVVASDERDNGQELVLRGSRISSPLLVDNRKPELVGVTARYPWVSGMARDSYSAIQAIEYSVDGGPWQMVTPGDGIYDTPTERFRFHLPDKLAPGAHIVAVRARDAADNAGVVQIRFVR